MVEEPEPYRRPFVVLAPDPLGYRVFLDPPISDLARTYRRKDDAWRYAQDLWTAMRAPLRDLTDSNTAREPLSYRPEKSGVSSESRSPKITGGREN